MQERPRVIITTDMEVDDMNSTIHLALYLNHIDLEAIVYTASQYHFQGDGIHTLGEVNPHWRTKGVRSYECAVVPREPDPEAGALRRYRPFPERWIENLWEREYARAYPNLQANAQVAGEPAFPTPEELIARTYVGNVAFEGDVREDTPGSDAIKRAIMDDDPRTLWLLSWGGMNTIVRALMSIAAEYAGTPLWEDVRERVYTKVRVLGVMDGVGQDNSWKDYGEPLFPKLQLLRTPFPYGGYVDAKCAQPASIELFRAPWPAQNLIEGNGPLMERYMLYGDGKVYENEPERFQFGIHATLDWGWPGMDPLQFERGDFMAEGDSMTYIPLLDFGLRGAGDPSFDTILGPIFNDGDTPSVEGAPMGLDSLGKPTNQNVNPFLSAYQEDFAARAQWCARKPEECSHPARIENATADCTASAGEGVKLKAQVIDPNGAGFDATWTVSPHSSSYRGVEDLASWCARTVQGTFTVPADAQTGDRFVLTLSVKTRGKRPCTRYAQVAVTVR